MDSVWLAIWGVIASVAIIWVFAWLLGVYETRRREKLEAKRDAERGSHATS